MPRREGLCCGDHHPGAEAEADEDDGRHVGPDDRVGQNRAGHRRSCSGHVPGVLGDPGREEDPAEGSEKLAGPLGRLHREFFDSDLGRRRTQLLAGEDTERLQLLRTPREAVHGCVVVPLADDAFPARTFLRWATKRR